MKRSLLVVVALLTLSGCAGQSFNQPWKQGFFAVQMACPQDEDMILDNPKCQVIGLKKQNANVDIATEGDISPK